MLKKFQTLLLFLGKAKNNIFFAFPRYIKIKMVNKEIEKAKEEYKENRSIRFDPDWQMRRFNISYDEAVEKIKKIQLIKTTIIKNMQHVF